MRVSSLSSCRLNLQRVNTEGAAAVVAKLWLLRPRLRKNVKSSTTGVTQLRVTVLPQIGLRIAIQKLFFLNETDVNKQKQTHVRLEVFINPNNML